MTPTEQDKELLSKLDRLIIENQSYDGSIDISDQRPMRDEILELITADRKRVALEARINTAEHILNTMVSRAGGYCDEIKPDAIPDYIAELKAQQEEV